jgi:hydrogenase-4 component B
MAEFFVLQVNDSMIESLLPLIIVLIPLIGSFLIGLIGLKSNLLRNLFSVAVSGLTVYLALELFLTLLNGYKVVYSLPALAGIEMGFRVDLFGSVFTLFSAIIWFLAVLASIPYMSQDPKQTRYYVFLIMSLAGCLGVFICGDFLSLFLFFELMTLAAYALVVHNQTKEALSAGGNYLYLGVIGGLSLLSGIILLYVYTGSVAMVPSLQNIIHYREIAVLIAALMIAGFGVKAGMIPLHIWLPQAHPVAPAPASALLSGIMIKTGAYGIIRVAVMLYTPAAELAESKLWHFTENLGHLIIWIGIVTMLLAAIMAVLQDNAKRLLAYSSISQMGYILMGVGAAAYLGYDGPMGFGGFSYHIINHAFFKSGFFILFGIIYTRLHEVDMGKLGGLWKSFPFTFAAFAVCAAGITGIPGFNGYASKTLLHHAIVEAFEHHHLWDLWLAEKLFMLTSGLTICYIAKLLIRIFLGSCPGNTAARLKHKGAGENWLERLIALSFIGVISFLGLFPEIVIKKVLVPMTEPFTFAEYYINYLYKTNIWNIHDIFGIVIGFALGAGFYLLFTRKDLFSLKPPDYLSVEYSVYRPVTAYLGATFTKAGRFVDENLNYSYHGTPFMLSRVSDQVSYFDDQLLRKAGSHISQTGRSAWDGLYELWAGNINSIFGVIGFFLRKVFMTLFKFDYSTRGDERFQTVNISNIDFDLYIVLIVIGAILATSLLFIL